MTRYLSSSGLKPGDVILFSKNEDNYTISYRRQDEKAKEASEEVVKITLSDTWKYIKF